MLLSNRYVENPMKSKAIQLAVKQFMDFTLSLCLLLLLLPLFIIVSIAICLETKGSFLFIQERVGKNEKLFRIYKFRTMVKNAQNMGLKHRVIENDPRITRVGRVLRLTSIDELPQLINILKGHMSFIGPRPTLKYQTDQYDAYHKQRLLMKPGMTGLAQVKGRKSLDWNERFKYDIYYIHHYSLLLDAKIFLLTIKTLFNTKVIYRTTDPWTGKNIKNKNE